MRQQQHPTRLRGADIYHARHSRKPVVKQTAVARKLAEERPGRRDTSSISSWVAALILVESGRLVLTQPEFRMILEIVRSLAKEPVTV